MKRLTNQIISFILLIAMVCSLSVPAFAAIPEKDIFIDDGIVAEAVREQCERLSPEAKSLFLQAISSDSELVSYYQKNIDSSFVPIIRHKRAIAASDPLKQLERNLKALSLPTAVVVSLMAVGSGFVAAAADGPLVFGDAYLAVTATGAAVVLGLHWSLVAPKFPDIVKAFQQCFKDSVSVITDVFGKLQAEAKTASAKKRAEDAAKGVSNKVKKKGSSDTVDLDQFKDKNGRTPKNKNSGTFTSEKDGRYTIEKDTAGHTGYDGSTKVWKLNLNGKRVASLNKVGKIVGD